MAATTYQILYHGTNENMNKIITNPQELPLEQYSEILHSEHKIAHPKATLEEKQDATLKRDDGLVTGNSPDCDKYSGLYEYAGSKRIDKWDWIPEYEGYVIRDWDGIIDQITDTNYGSENGDYSGKYLLFEGNTPENGIVVAKQSPLIEKYKGDYVVKHNMNAENGMYYKNVDELKEEFINATIAEIDFQRCPLMIDLASIIGTNKPDPTYFTIPTYTYPGGSEPSYAHTLSVKIGSDATFIPSVSVDRSVIYNAMRWKDFKNYVSNGKVFVKDARLKDGHLKRYTIPAHWEKSSKNPYCVHDAYKKVSQEPWFVYSTEHSFTQALDKCRMLVEKIGLENVELIKVVPTDQFLRIR